MDHKERMLAAIRGEALERIPWVPRMDLWYKANVHNGTLPARYAGACLEDILEDNGFGFHAVIPDFLDRQSEEDDADRALGLYNLHFMPYRFKLPGIEREILKDGDHTRITYHTPVGTITTGTVYNDSMREAGITITHVDEYAFKTADDYRALSHIFREIQVVENHAGYQAWADTIGDRGIACGYVSTAAAPMHLIQKELMPYDIFFFEQTDHPDELAELAAAIGSFWERVMEVCAASPAPVFFGGGNFDASMTYPPFFEEHITPWISRFADQLHAQGKYLLCHTDGENRGLLPHYQKSGFDIADSVCPAPMTSQTFQELRDGLGADITTMGGIPSVSLLPSSIPDRDFEAFLDDFFSQVGSGRRLILGISDTTPPDADLERIVRIARKIEEFGPVV